MGAGGTIGNCPDRPAIRALLDAGTHMGAESLFEENTADIFGPGSFAGLLDELHAGVAELNDAGRRLFSQWLDRAAAPAAASIARP